MKTKQQTAWAITYNGIVSIKTIRTTRKESIEAARGYWIMPWRVIRRIGWRATKVTITAAQ